MKFAPIPSDLTFQQFIEHSPPKQVVQFFRQITNHIEHLNKVLDYHLRIVRTECNIESGGSHVSFAVEVFTGLERSEPKLREGFA
jgi:hypothetical protein